MPVNDPFFLVSAHLLRLVTRAVKIHNIRIKYLVPP